MANYISKVKLPNNSTYDIKDSRISVDSNGKIALSNLPDIILGQMIYGGTFVITGTGTTHTVTATLSTNAKTKLGTESPTVQLVNSADGGTNTYGWKANEGIYYICQTGATVWGLDFEEGDWLVSTGSSWKKIDNTDAVKSVNGHTGIVTGLEETSNKVTGWSTTTTDTHYPSEKLVKDSLDTKVIEAGTGTNSAVQIGLANSASGTGAMAVNGSNAASGENSFAEGSHTRSTGRATHAEGNTTLASGDYSHAEGAGSGTIGVASHAEGNGTSAQNFAEHAEGSHNATHKDSDDFGSAGNTIHSIGIGTGLQARKNAVEVMQNGDVYINGIGDYDGTDVADADTLQDVIDNKISEPASEGTSGQVLTTDGNGGRSWTTVSGEPYTEITYSALKTLKDGNGLSKGTWYRITDYVTTTAQSNTQSAQHNFDLLVLATDVNKLDCLAKALPRSGDTYFANSDLSKWQIWYDIENNASKYAWANTANGKGVIYRMIDEFNNDCPYDFKNIQFAVGAKTGPGTVAGVYYYTFSYAYDMADTSVDDHSLNGGACYGNTLGRYINSNKISLNFNVFRNTSVNSNCYSNTFGNDCYRNTFGDSCYSSTFGNSCYINTFGNDCYSDTFGNYCRNNTFGNNNRYNIFRDNCYINTFGDYCYSNAFGDNYYSNTFGSYCYRNAFGNNNIYNTFGDSCYSITFGNYCYNNTFGNNCYNNTFGNSCGHITFGNSSNQYSNYYSHNILENGCQYIRLYNTSTASVNQQLQNVKVSQGISGTSSNFIEISTISRNLGYQTKVAKNSSGDLKIYCEADLIQ